MSTHHTLVLSTQQSVTPATWNQLFEDAGGTMNLAWTDFEPSEVLEESADKRVLFFWTRGGEMSHCPPDSTKDYNCKIRRAVWSTSSI